MSKPPSWIVAAMCAAITMTLEDRRFGQGGRQRFLPDKRRGHTENESWVQNLSLAATNEVKTNAIQLATTAIKPPHIALLEIGFNAKGRVSATVATQAQGIANHQRKARGSSKESEIVIEVDESRFATPKTR
jgi:hypothetical protein